MSGVLFYNKCRIKTDVLTSIQLTEAEEKDVNFYDYDGFRLLSYTNAEALALTELPANPAVNENLTFDEWNWTLADIKTQINNVGGIVNVGASYHTTDNKMHIICKPTEIYPQAHINLTPTVVNDVTIDWGDGTTDIWTTTSATTKSHTYTGVTDSSVYDITISCSSGTYSFSTYIAGSDTNNKNCVYTDIRLSNKTTTLPQNCFMYCYSLQSINMPSVLNFIATSPMYLFGECHSLSYITIPKNNTFVETNFCSNCYSLKNVSIPATVTRMNGFSACYSLQSITIPYNTISLGASNFSNTSLQTVIVPSNVSNIGANCFNYCYGLNELYMMPTTPPVLANTNAILNNNNLVIYVPTGYLSDYQTAENWSTFSSKMVEYTF